MLRVLSSLVLAWMLLRCAFSEEARREFHTYRENASKAQQVFDLIGALFGLALLGVVAVGMYHGVLEFYRIANGD